MKKVILAAVMFCFLLPAGAHAYLVPTKRTDVWAELKQINLQALQGEFMKFATNIQGLQALQDLKKLTKFADDLQKMMDGFGNFNFDFQSILSGLSEDLLSGMSVDSGKMPKEIMNLFKGGVHKTANLKIADEIKKQMEQQASKIRGGSAGGSTGAALGSVSAGSQADGKEIAAKTVEDLGKYYPASVPGAQETIVNQIYGGTTTVTDAKTAAFAASEVVRTKALEKSMQLMAPYVKGEDGKSQHDKKIEELRKAEEEISKKVEEDAKASGNELEVLRSIASMTSGLVSRQANTNQILILQMEQEKDQIEQLNHIGTMLAEIYSHSIRTNIDQSVERLRDSGGKIRTRQ